LIERERDCEPVPHDLVHVVQALKARTVQWIGHGPCVHTTFWVAGGHVLPPWRGCWRLRVRDFSPLPHDLLHWPKAPHWPTTQSVGHVCGLQARASLSCGHPLPPFSGCVVLRERRCQPEPHD
jgi:hypothetical protein